jgi:hypothetical protein
MKTIRAFAVAALLVPGAVAAADTDLENPGMRELPIQRGGPVVGGKRLQPTRSDVEERSYERAMTRAGGPGSGPSAEPAARDRHAQELYNRVIQQSDRPTPRSIDPSR